MKATSPSNTSLATAAAAVDRSAQQAAQAKKAMTLAKARYKSAKKTWKQARKASHKAAKLAQKAERHLKKLERQAAKGRKAEPVRKTRVKTKARPGGKAPSPPKSANHELHPVNPSPAG